MYSLRISYEPVESVTVMLALGRSRMTVSFTPEVTAGPLPAVPGNRGTGSVVEPTTGVMFGNTGGLYGPVCVWLSNVLVTSYVCSGCPLFQLVIVPQSPLASFHHSAGTSISFSRSMPPLSTSASIALVVL